MGQARDRIEPQDGIAGDPSKDRLRGLVGTDRERADDLEAKCRIAVEQLFQLRDRNRGMIAPKHAERERPERRRLVRVVEDLRDEHLAAELVNLRRRPSG